MGAGVSRWYALHPFRGVCDTDLTLSPVLIMFAVGTSLRLAYRRWAGLPSPTVDARVHSPTSRVPPVTKVSFPAMGVTRGRVHTSREALPPDASLSSRSGK